MKLTLFGFLIAALAVLCWWLTSGERESPSTLPFGEVARAEPAPDEQVVLVADADAPVAPAEPETNETERTPVDEAPSDSRRISLGDVISSEDAALWTELEGTVFQTLELRAGEFDVTSLSGNIILSNGGEIVSFTVHPPKLEDGLHTSYHENGKKSAEGMMRRGQRVGIWTAWHENGERSSEGDYYYGVKNGPWAIWNSDGKQSSSGSYQYDRKEGLWTDWHGNGKRRSVALYRNDSLEDKRTTWFADGSRESEGSYQNGDKEGQWTEWWETGERRSRGRYHYGERTGHWDYWNSDGTKDEERTGKYEEDQKNWD